MKIILAGILGGVAVFIWGSISWMILPWHNMTLQNLPNEDVVMDCLKNNIPTSGAYYFPGWPHDEPTEKPSAEAQQRFEEKHKQGPIGFLVYGAEGRPAMAADVFLKGLGLDVIAALLAALLLSRTALGCYRCRVQFVTALGIFAGIVSHLASWNWMYFPSAYSFTMVADLAVGWLVAGLIIGAIIKKPFAQTQQ